MNKYVKVYVGRNFDNIELIDDLFHNGYESETCMKQQKRNIRQFKKAVKNNGDKLPCGGDKWDSGLYIHFHTELKDYNPNNILVLTLNNSIPKKSLECFEHIDLFEYLETSGINMELFHVTT